MKKIDWIVMAIVLTLLIILLGVVFYIDNPISQLPSYLKNSFYFGFFLGSVVYVMNVLIVYGIVKEKGWPQKEKWRDYWKGFSRDFKNGFLK
ncbi:hypothetical protein M6C35_001991 [Vibrio metschnikovii]|nr:hypothetical protein [Vibrio metschnikovii]